MRKHLTYDLTYLTYGENRKQPTNGHGSICHKEVIVYDNQSLLVGLEVVLFTSHNSRVDRG